MSEKPAAQRMTWSRRGWLSAAGIGLVGSAASLEAGPGQGATPNAQAPRSGAPALPLAEFEPKSMLHVKETPVARALSGDRLPHPCFTSTRPEARRAAGRAAESDGRGEPAHDGEPDRRI